MGRAAGVALAVGLGVAAVAWPQSGLRLDLGLGAEYWDEDHSGSRQESLRAAIDVVLSGAVLDPRFLTFSLGLHASDFAVAQDGEETSTTRPISYEAGFSAFSNRMVTVRADASREDTETTGSVSTGGVAGVRTSYGGGVGFRRAGFPDLRFDHYETDFVADDLDLYRDESQTVDSLEGLWREGRFQAALDARVEDRSFSGHRIATAFDLANLTLDWNRGGRNSLFGLFQASRSETAVDGQSNPEATSFLARTNYTRTWQDVGFMAIRYDHHTGTVGDDSTSNDQIGASLRRTLSEAWAVEAEASYLVGSDSAGREARQPAAYVGLPWMTTRGALTLGLTPRVTYTGEPYEGADIASSWGCAVYGTTRWLGERSSVLGEVEVVRNNYSIVPLGPEGSTGGGSLIAGQETERTMLRLTALHRFTSRLGVEASGTYRTRTRLFQQAEADETETLGLVRVVWRQVALLASGSSVEVTGTDVPFTRDVVESRLDWTPRYWLTCFARVASESSTDPVATWDSETDEAGLDLRYAKLTFFTRWQRYTYQTSTSAGPVEDQRLWVGFRRWFGVEFGG